MDLFKVWAARHHDDIETITRLVFGDPKFAGAEFQRLAQFIFSTHVPPARFLPLEYSGCRADSSIFRLLLERIVRHYRGGEALCFVELDSGGSLLSFCGPSDTICINTAILSRGGNIPTISTHTDVNRFIASVLAAG